MEISYYVMRYGHRVTVDQISAAKVLTIFVLRLPLPKKIMCWRRRPYWSISIMQILHLSLIAFDVTAIRPHMCSSDGWMLILRLKLICPIVEGISFAKYTVEWYALKLPYALSFLYLDSKSDGGAKMPLLSAWSSTQWRFIRNIFEKSSGINARLSLRRNLIIACPSIRQLVFKQLFENEGWWSLAEFL